MEAGTMDQIVEFARRHQDWAAPIAFFTGMGESIVGVSLFIQSTPILLALASLGAVAESSLLTVWLAAGLGAAAGDWISYGLGYRFGEPMKKRWPLSRKPELLDMGHRFFERWGVLSLFVCRFLGPARSVIMLIAGMSRMPLAAFFLASLASAMLWAGVVLAPAGLFVSWLTEN
jgi:membrane protein DedA with SNARE-associated domain